MELPDNETCVSEMTEVREEEGSSCPSKRRRVSASGSGAAMQSDFHLLSGGVNAIINALSCQNPGARDYAALALILLTSQGGHEVKSLVARAGAMPLLVSMAETGSSITKELAAGAIASLVSLHPENRLAVIRLGGLKALMDMAKGAISNVNGMIKARIQTAAAVAVLNLSEAFDRCEVGMWMGIEGALLQAMALLEDDQLATMKAGLGGLQAIANSISVGPKLSFELVSALLDVTKSSSLEVRLSALQELETLCFSRGTLEAVRRDAMNLIVWLLDNFSTLPGLPEAIVKTITRNTPDGPLGDFIFEKDWVHRLLRLVSECPSLPTSSLAMCCLANLAARKKQLVDLRVEGVSLIISILASDPVKFEKDVEMACSGLNCCFHKQHEQSRVEIFNAHASLREHSAAVLVYFALSGSEQKMEIVAAGGVSVLVKLLETRFVSPEGISGVSSNLTSLGTFEFLVMVLIVLADKSPICAERIVEAGGVPVFLRILSTPGCGGKFGAPWSEMAAAALLTMAECEAARAEMIHHKAIHSLVQVLRGETKVSEVGAAAMVQLLGIFASSSEGSKAELRSSGAPRCVAEVFTQSSAPVVEEAGASALANLSLDSPENAAEICSTPGAVESLVRLLDPAGLSAEKSGLKLGAALIAVKNLISCCKLSRKAFGNAGGAEKLQSLLNSRWGSYSQCGDKIDPQKLNETAAHVLKLLTS